MIKNMPRIALGTSQLTEYEILEPVINKALAVGYKHIDTAQLYFNEEIIGEVLKKNPMPRKEYWITSKIHPINFKHFTELSIKESLKKLQTSYLDAMLLHSGDEPTITLRAYKKLIQAQTDGLVNHIGVSNMTIKEIETLYGATGVYPEYNQVIFSVKARMKELEEYCKEKDITLIGFSTVAPYYIEYGNELLNMSDEDKAIVDQIAKKYNKTPALVMLAYSKQSNYVVLTRTSKAQRVQSNFEVQDFELSREDLEKLESLTTYTDEAFNIRHDRFDGKYEFKDSLYEHGMRISKESDEAYKDYMANK